MDTSLPKEKKQDLDLNQYQCLCALAFLYLRMGFRDKAIILFTALLEITKSPKKRRWIYKNLAYLELKNANYTLCLEYLREAIGDGVLKSKDTILYLVKAEALWLSGRQKEAKNTLQHYYTLV